MPLIVTVCPPRPLVPRPLVPLPSEVRFTSTVPLIDPAVPCAPLPSPTVMLVPFAPPAASTLIVPLLSLAEPVTLPKPASKPSLYPSLVAVFWMLRAEVPKALPTWILARLIGVVIELAAARR